MRFLGTLIVKKKRSRHCILKGMWKFKTSVYKNAAPKPSKKDEWIGDISASNISSSCGNHIKASAAYMVFNIDSGGGSSIGLLPTSTTGKLSDPIPTVQAHSNFVTDFDFSPFDDYLLSTCSQDSTVKIWHLPVDVSVDPICNPSATLSIGDRAVELVLWNPVAENVLALASQQSVKIYDVERQTARIDLSSHEGPVQSVSWRLSGCTLASACRDKQLRVFDVRAAAVAQSTSSHQGVKDSRVLWMGDKDMILSSGFNAMRQREITLRDTRNLSASLKTISVDSSTGTLMPLYDSDTGMLFLAGKGDSSIRYLELTDKEPFLVENSVDQVEQTIKGCAVLSKRALDVMSCEVNRLLTLTASYIIPFSYCVPRKSYRDFHQDLFPDTFDGLPLLTSDEWFSGKLATLDKSLSLNPAKKAVLTLRRPFGSETDVSVGSQPARVKAGPVPEHKADPVPENNGVPTELEAPATQAVSSSQDEDVAVETNASRVDEGPQQTDHGVQPSRELKHPKAFSGMKQSKFRHIEGSTVHKSLHIENLRNVSQSMPGESDGFHANLKYCAIPMSGSAGVIAIIQTDQAGRLPDTGLPAVENGSVVTDFAWDPFNNSRLAVACDDAKIRIWTIPEDGIDGTLTEPSSYLKGHTEKIYSVHFHPLASGVLASTSYDMTVRVWDVVAEEERIVLHGHADTIFNLAWSSYGKKCATLCKDGKIRMYEPRISTEPLSTGKGLEGSRGGRVVWTCSDQLLAVTGFDRTSVRQIAVYGVADLSSALHKIDLNTSPSILIPFYDEDSSVLFATGRGDSIVYTFEVSADTPQLSVLSDFKADCLHQALSFLPKSSVNVRKVELARAMRLTSNSIEPVTFRVPRLKVEYFQDDIFPDTRVTWEPALSGTAWFSGDDASARTISLRPTDMQLLSTAPTESARQSKYENFHVYAATHKTDEQKKEELLKGWKNKLDLSDAPLPQDLYEGVDPDEWDD